MEFINSNITKAALIGMIMGTSATVKQVELSITNERIEEIRGLIISGGKTEEEMNELLDELQKLAVKKRDIESLIASIKRMNKKCEELDEKEKHDSKLSKLTSKEEEA